MDYPTSFSQQQQASLPAPQPVQQQRNAFPSKLYKLLAQAERLDKTDVVSWTPDGMAFKVHDKERFLKELMPSFFSTGNYQTFQRNLNLWGFRTVSKGLRKGECSNSNFQRGRPELCSNCTRIRIKTYPNDAMSAGSIHSSTSSLNHSRHDLPPWQQPQRMAAAPNQSMTPPPPQQEAPSQLQQLMGLLNAQQPPQNSTTDVASMLLNALGSGSSPSEGTSRDPLSAVLAAFSPTNTSPGSNDPSGALPAIASLLGNGGSASSTNSNQPTLDVLAGLLGQSQQQQQRAPSPSNAGGFTAPILALQQQLLQKNGGSAPDAATMSHMHPPNSVQLSRGANIAPTSDVSSTTSSANSYEQQWGSVPKRSLSDGGVPTEKPLASVVKSKQEREAAIQRGSRIIPCRARGMPMDHSGHTAFFEITKDMTHGAELMCSHAVCRNGGIKFLFCSFCDGPVARRSFRAQHSHPGEVQPIRSVAHDSAVGEAFSDKKKRKKDGQGPPRKRARSAAAAAAAQLNAEEAQLPSLLVNLANARLNVENSGASSNDGDDDEAGKVNPNRSDRSTNIITSKCSDTSSSETQSDQGGSDSDAVLGENNGANAANEEQRTRNEWLALLSERRRLASTTDMTSWLMRVLAISDPSKRPPEAISDEIEVSSDLTTSGNDDRKPAAKENEEQQPPKEEAEKASDSSETTKTDSDMLDAAPAEFSKEQSKDASESPKAASDTLH